MAGARVGSIRGAAGAGFVAGRGPSPARARGRFGITAVESLAPGAHRPEPVGYAALALAFASAIVYLMQDHRLRGKHPPLSGHLPSVQAADDTSYRLVAIGFPLLTAGS